jgi:hypothetical protein
MGHMEIYSTKPGPLMCHVIKRLWALLTKLWTNIAWSEFPCLGRKRGAALAQ